MFRLVDECREPDAGPFDVETRPVLRLRVDRDRQDLDAAVLGSRR